MITHCIHGITASLAFALTFLLLAAGGATAAGLGQTCGGLPNIQCDVNLWCEKPSGRCGVVDSAGVCAKAPEICMQLYKPVCGCNGLTYANDCVRQRGKVALNHNGVCK